ncbi:MAG: 30S ribosomal protein S18 [Chloroflexi bacterium]|nr:30S ribosomal protein S18 [Chloroflexota bacterium]
MQARPGTGPRRPFRGRGERKPRFIPRRKVCTFCTVKDAVIDYKDAVRLRRFLSDSGKIERRYKTGTCARHQRALATAISRARLLALLPYTAAHIRRIAGVSPAAAPPPPATPATPPAAAVPPAPAATPQPASA